MKAVQLDRFGGPDALALVEVPRPEPGPGEVLIRVRAAGINFFETLMLRDRYVETPELPMVPGVEVAGEVVRAGEDVTVPAIGTRVAVPLFAFGRGSGGYAEYLSIDAAAAIPIPENISYEAAVALMVQGLTALHLVRQSPPQGKIVLVTAAAGGVGSLLVQLAKLAGAKRVIAVVSNSRKLDIALSLGAELGVLHSQEDWAERVRETSGGVGVDIAFEMVGGEHTRSCLRALAPRGEMVFGALGRFDLRPAELEGMFLHNQSIRGFALLPHLAASDPAADLQHLFDLAANGSLKIVQNQAYSLEQAGAAHHALESRSSVGKLVLRP